MAAAFQILGWLKEWFDKEGYRYELKADTNVLKASFNLDSKLKNCNLVFGCAEDTFSSYAYIPLDADESCRVRVAEYILRANYGLRYGSFEMDYRDGEIRYHVQTDCTGLTKLPEHLFRRAIGIPINMFERYGDGLIAVMYDIKSPESAIQDAEKE